VNIKWIPASQSPKLYEDVWVAVPSFARGVGIGYWTGIEWRDGLVPGSGNRIAHPYGEVTFWAEIEYPEPPQ